MSIRLYEESPKLVEAAEVVEVEALNELAELPRVVGAYVVVGFEWGQIRDHSLVVVVLVKVGLVEAMLTKQTQCGRYVNALVVTASPLRHSRSRDYAICNTLRTVLLRVIIISTLLSLFVYASF